MSLAFALLLRDIFHATLESEQERKVLEIRRENLQMTLGGRV